MNTADAILLVVDAVGGATATDEAAVRVLRRSKTPVILVANKVDDARTEAEAAALWSLGLGEPHMVSATHGRGTGDLLDEVLRCCGDSARGHRRRRAAACRARRQAERRQVEPAQQAVR